MFQKSNVYLRNDILGKLIMAPKEMYMLIIKQKDYVSKVKKSIKERNPRIKPQ